MKPSRECPLCHHKYPGEKNRCPSCGHWSFTADVGPGNHDVKTDGSVLFEDIDEAAIERLSTGIIDDCLGGGIIRTDVILIGGGPGAGKSTLVLQICEAFCKHGTVMYVAAEEDVKAIKLRGKRLDIKTHRRLRLLPALSGVANVGAMLWAHRPNFIIMDSIDSLSGRNADEEIVILTILKKFCVELQAPAIVISQINKAGDYAGLKAKQHAVDVLVTFDADPVERDPEGGDYIRIMETIKNRSGRAGVRQFFCMTPSGLVPTLDPSLVDPDDDAPESDSAPDTYEP